MIIDCHTHIFPRKIIEQREYYCHHDSLFAELYLSIKAKLATVEDLINNMDKCGIDISVILNINWMKHDICVEVNDYLLESVSRYPGRLIGFCGIQPSAGDKAIKELERCIKYGVKGLGEIRLNIGGLKSTQDSFTKDIVGILRNKGCTLMLHSSEPVGHTYSGKGLITPNVLYQFITLYPDLKIICAHWGGGLPFYALMPEVNENLQNVYFDTAATPYLYKAEIFKAIISIIGSHKLIFGSDYPLMSPRKVLDYMSPVRLKAKDLNNIICGTAKKILGLKGIGENRFGK